jgi:hypothetical protein
MTTTPEDPNVTIANLRSQVLPVAEQLPVPAAPANGTAESVQLPAVPAEAKACPFCDSRTLEWEKCGTRHLIYLALRDEGTRGGNTALNGRGNDDE